MRSQQLQPLQEQLRRIPRPRLLNRPVVATAVRQHLPMAPEMSLAREPHLVPDVADGALQVLEQHPMRLTNPRDSVVPIRGVVPRLTASYLYGPHLRSVVSPKPIVPWIPSFFRFRLTTRRMPNAFLAKGVQPLLDYRVSTSGLPLPTKRKTPFRQGPALPWVNAFETLRWKPRPLRSPTLRPP